MPDSSSIFSHLFYVLQRPPISTRLSFFTIAGVLCRNGYLAGHRAGHVSTTGLGQSFLYPDAYHWRCSHTRSAGGRSGYSVSDMTLAFLHHGFLSLFTLTGVHFFLPETKADDNSYKFKNVFKTYVHILTDKKFLGYALAESSAQAGMFAYITGSPFLFIEYFGIPSKYYGLIFGANAFALITFSQVNARLVHRHSLQKILNVVFSAILLLSFALIIAGAIGKHFLVVAIPLFFFIGSLGMIFRIQRPLHFLIKEKCR